MYFTIFLDEKIEEINYFELCIIGYIESFKNGCYKKTENIAKDLKCSVTTLRRAIKHLIELKMLFKYKTKGKHYILLRHERNKDKKELEEKKENKEWQIIEQLKNKLGVK